MGRLRGLFPVLQLCCFLDLPEDLVALDLVEVARRPITLDLAEVVRRPMTHVQAHAWAIAYTTHTCHQHWKVESC